MAKTMREATLVTNENLIVGWLCDTKYNSSQAV
jgi:hypothetical protein